MKNKYFIEMYAIVEAKNREEAREIAHKLVNCKLDSNIGDKIIRYSYADEFGKETITKYKEI